MPDADAMHAAAEWLSSIPYLAELDRATLHAVTHTAIQRTYTAEQIVFLEGDPSGGLYVVEEDWLKAVKLAPDGREQVLSFLGPGEVFNAVGVFASESNPATVIALELSTLWVIQRETMLRLLNALLVLMILPSRIRAPREEFDVERQEDLRGLAVSGNQMPSV